MVMYKKIFQNLPIYNNNDIAYIPFKASILDVEVAGVEF